MGTLSLIFGIIGIITGSAFAIPAVLFLTTDPFPSSAFYVVAGISVISFVIGSGLVKKYDNDKKKEKTQNS